MRETVSALIVAAGTGERFGGSLPKVYADLCGEPMFVWSLQAFDSLPEVTDLVLVVAEEHLDRARAICRMQPLETHWSVVPGGPRRQDSVRMGLEAMAQAGPDIVCIHDAARPLVTHQIIRQSIELCRRHGAAVASVPISDTVKSFAPDGAVAETLDRSRLRAMQTPQTFSYELIVAAHRKVQREGLEITDDAAALELCGQTAIASPGAKENVKVTVPEDLPYVEWLLRRRFGRLDTAGVRAGYGYDLHRLVEGRRLVLCGIEFDHERGLLGHSDADVALHALADAILGAAALGDIGEHFPDTDPTFRDADSALLLAEAVEMAAQAGWAVSNVDMTIVAEEPKIAPQREEMRRSVASILGVDASCVSVKATTDEGLGPIGEGQAIACHAVATLLPMPSEFGETTNGGPR